ncbi:hypothetical protein ADL26_15605, partial [Thermoactinomyces vulgaris]
VDRFDRRMLLWLAGAARVAAMGGLFAAAVIWVAGLATPWWWALGVYVLTGTALAWTVKRLRYTLALRRSVGGALRQFNAFGPAGTRPKADRSTGKLLREVLTNLPAARP